MKHVTGSETSEAAGESVVDLRSLQVEVYNAILKAPHTDDELQDLLGMNPSTERPRRIELVEKHLVRDSGRRRPTKSGRLAVVWEVVRAPEPVKDSTGLLAKLRMLTGTKA